MYIYILEQTTHTKIISLSLSTSLSPSPHSHSLSHTRTNTLVHTYTHTKSNPRVLLLRRRRGKPDYWGPSGDGMAFCLMIYHLLPSPPAHSLYLLLQTNLLLLNNESKDVSKESEVSKMPSQNDWIPAWTRDPDLFLSDIFSFPPPPAHLPRPSFGPVLSNWPQPCSYRVGPGRFYTLRVQSDLSYHRSANICI
jgi:hypothetical protein